MSPSTHYTFLSPLTQSFFPQQLDSTTLACPTHFINQFFTTNQINVLHTSLADYSEEINGLPIYNIFFKYFTLIGLWDFFNKKVAVKGTVHMGGYSLCTLWEYHQCQKSLDFALIGGFVWRPGYYDNRFLTI